MSVDTPPRPGDGLRPIPLAPPAPRAPGPGKEGAQQPTPDPTSEVGSAEHPAPAPAVDDRSPDAPEQDAEETAVGTPRGCSGHTTAPPAFADDAVVKPRPLAARGGWRRAVVTATGGRVDPGLSAAEVAERDREQRIRRPIQGCRRVAVVSRKGGVGKSTITALAGAALAALRGDRVVAVDCNPDAGTLAYRVARDHERTITDLLADWPGSVDRYQDVHRYTSQDPESRLEVVASNVDPRVTGSLTAEDYRQALAGLERHFTLILIDTGTDIRHAAARTALDVADQLIVVVAPSLDGARAAAQTLDWLDEHGHGDLVNGAVAVLNGVARHRGVDLQAITQHFASRCRATATVPWDPVLEAGAHAGLDAIQRSTRNAYLDLAAALADGFPHPEGAPA